MTRGGKYQREPESLWYEAMDGIVRIEDPRDRALARMRYALGEGAAFLALADREISGGLPFETDEQWGDFFESAEAETARREVHGAANAAFCALTLEQKLRALAALDDVEESRD